MSKMSSSEQLRLLLWHRSLLVAGAVFTVLLIAMGGILCMTQSIRNCPDWPGCFGRVIPPAETGPILEYTHRLLAGISGLLVVSTAIAGMLLVPRLRWISIPPLLALALLIEVSFFGAQVVLRGLAPGWAAVDVGSALLVVALMVTAASKACMHQNAPNLADTPGFGPAYTRLLLATTIVVYVVLVSGILVTGKGSITGCLGWPIYNLKQFQLDGLVFGNILRLIVSIAGIGMLIAVVVLAWQHRREYPELYHTARWVGLAFLVEAVVQVLLQVSGLVVPLLIIYTVTAASLWALLIALLVRASSRPLST